MADTMRPLNAFRTRLVGDTALQTYVGVDTATTSARVYPMDLIDVDQPVYPCITLVFDRSRLGVWVPRTIDPGFMTAEFYSKIDQRQSYEMYEIASRLLHDQKTALSTSGFCCHFVQEVAFQRARFQDSRSVWRVAATYKFYATILT